MGSTVKEIVLCLLLGCVGVALSGRFAPSDPGDADNLQIHIKTGGDYSLSVRNRVWVNSAPTFFRADGTAYTALVNLKLTATKVTTGTDAFGAFRLVTFTYLAGHSEIEASIKTYDGQPFILFRQVYVNGANKTRSWLNDNSISGFPAFLVEKPKPHQLGFLAYGGQMCGDSEKHMGGFSTALFRIKSGMAGGPLALFDGNGDTLIISPVSNFMAASNWFLQSEEEANLYYGLMGGVDTVPAQTSVDFIVYYSSGGVNKAFEEWGSYLRGVYGRTDAYVRSDLTNNYLGYWTDNGAYYYYNTLKNATYEQTMLDTKAYADKTNIPYRYWQYDSWWYYKGVGNGVKTWEARPDIFPDGFQSVWNKMGQLPVSGHNRFWSSDTTYAKQNGGAYNFVVEHMLAVPDDQNLWNDLFKNASSWGLYTYEQDWLDTETMGLKALQSDLTLGARWLNQMAAGAKLNNMTIQYCMSYSRHIMQSLLNSVVTQARVSDDYHPGKDQWKIGISSIFAYAMGLAPFKDNFWSTTDQPGNPYNASEPHTEVQAIAAVLSTGPVGPSDMIGASNAALIMRCCNADGLILKPSKPATAVDEQIYRAAIPARTKGPNGEMWSTYSRVSGHDFGIIFVPEITGSYTITPATSGLPNTTAVLVVSDPRNATAMTIFSEASPLTITGCNTTQPCLYYVSPILKLNPEVYLIGELDKFVPVSPQRFTSIDVGDANDITMILQGSPNERVPLTFSENSQLQMITCVFGASGVATVSYNNRSCK